jgi:hypothetical protein
MAGSYINFGAPSHALLLLCFTGPFLFVVSGVFALYKDPSFQKALNVVIQLMLSVPLNESLVHPEDLAQACLTSWLTWVVGVI